MDSRETPRGRESVQDALITAATELFSARGPSAVSVREIAKYAQVNHGLVHRHFGSKEGLLRAVQNRLASDIAGKVGEPTEDESLEDLLGSVFGATNRQGHWLRILAWSVLDGEPEAEIQENFPLADRMLAAAKRHPVGPLSPEARVTHIMSVGLGLLLFGPFLRQATAQNEAQWGESLAHIMGLVSRHSSSP